MTDSDLDTRLLNQLQQALPLVRRPFESLAERIGCDEASVLSRIQALRGGEGVIREISGVFDAAALGYEQALVAMAVPEDALDAAGRGAASHPGVSHCYGRSLRAQADVPHYNLWLTLAVSPDSRLGLEKTGDVLAEDAGAQGHMVLRAIRRYKLAVRFDAGSPGILSSGVANTKPPETIEPTDTQRRAIRALQLDLPTKPEPFDTVAAAEGLDVDELLRVAGDLLHTGHMRRYGAVLRHRLAGARANVMVAWRAGDADAAGARAAQCDRVSHCLLRETASDWAYNLYTMIHGRDEQDCRMTIDELRATAELHDRVELWTRAEYAKRRVRLFADNEAQWEKQNTGDT